MMINYQKVLESFDLHWPYIIERLLNVSSWCDESWWFRMINRFEPVLQFTYTCDLLTNCLRRGCRLVFYISPHRMLKFKLLLSLSIVVIINSFIHSSENTTFMFMDIIPTRLFPSSPAPSSVSPSSKSVKLFLPKIPVFCLSICWR